MKRYIFLVYGLYIISQTNSDNLSTTVVAFLNQPEMRDHKIFCFLGLGEANISVSTTEIHSTTVTIITSRENDIIDEKSTITPSNILSTTAAIQPTEPDFSNSGFDEIERSARIIL